MRQACHGLDNERETVGEVVTRSTVQTHTGVVRLTGNDADAVVLDFVEPQLAGRRLRGRSGKARRDKARRQGTQRHGVKTFLNPPNLSHECYGGQIELRLPSAALFPNRVQLPPEAQQDRR
jgi:hypothetical protein